MKRSWNSITSIEDVNKIIEENNITTRRELFSQYEGLYRVCKINGWLRDKSFLPSANQLRRDSIKTIDDAKKAIKDNNINSRHQLEKHMSWLFTLCKNRGWLEYIKFPNSSPRTSSEIKTIEEFQRYIDDESINSRIDFQRKNQGLYAKASRRKILDKLVFPYDEIRKEGHWAYIKTVDDANRFIEENNISSWMDCRKRFSGFFSRCEKLGLCYDPAFSLKRSKIYWNEFITTIEDAQNFIEEHNILSPVDFETRFVGLYGLCLSNNWANDLVYQNRNRSIGEINITRYIENNLKDSEDFLDLLSISRKFVDLSNEFSYVYPDFLFQYGCSIYWIEYNGKQHYEYNSQFHTSMEDFNRQLRRDKAVRDFCFNSEYDISLIEIPYIFDTYEKIEELLNKLIVNGQQCLKDYYSLERINEELIKK